MKRIEQRASAALVLAGIVMALLLFFVGRLAVKGEKWAAYSANRYVYTDGVLDGITVTDRNGVVLAESRDGSYHYAEDNAVRTASVHALGDFRGFIGSGVLSRYTGALMGYSLVGGTPGGEMNAALTLDARLQTAAYNALWGRSGAVLVMNYETGEILCMVSSPGYDPNYDPDMSIDGLFINRCTGASFVPGSVFKLVTLAAAYETVPDLRERSFWCGHELAMDGTEITCTGWHADQTVEEALANSCNCAFAEIAGLVGAETIGKYAEKYGLSGTMKLDGMVTAAGRYDVAPAHSAYEAWSGIGQFNDMVTPYAMMRFCAAIAGGGTVQEPTLLLGEDNGKTRLMEPETAEFLGSCMNYNVVWAYGAGIFPGLDLCAKTGTAELGDGTTHAWFVGYLQSGAPLAFAVMLERGGGGLSQAGAVANTVLQQASEYYAENG